MCRRSLGVIVLAACLLTLPVSADMVGYWAFDDGAGTTAADSSGKGQNGTLVNNPTWFAQGKYGGCLQFDGTNDRVAVSGTWTLPEYTMAVWFRQDGGTGAQRDILSLENTAGGHGAMMEVGSDARLRFLHRAPMSSTGGAATESLYVTGPATGVWHHWAIVKTATDMISYVDGVQAGTQANNTTFDGPATVLTIGDIDSRQMRPWNGLIDDVRIYDAAMTEAEVKLAMSNIVKRGVATSPRPADKANDVLRGATLGWSVGEYAQTHDVYFGTDLQAVTDASREAPGAVLAAKGQTDATHNPGRLEFGQTYYWRIDEVNAPSAGGAIYKGDVWSFTVEPYSLVITDVNDTADSTYDASSVAGKTVDGSGLDATTMTHGTTASDMWISGMTPMPHWIQFSFDKAYKLDQMWVWNSNQTLETLFGLGAKSVLVQVSTDGTTWTDLGTFQFTKAPGNATCAADTKVPFNGAAAKYVKLNITSNWGGIFTQASLSEVRFYAIPTAAREPSPATGAVNLHPQVPMSWRAGREAGSHEVYVGSDANEVLASTTPTATVTAAEYDAALALGQTYYWKVVEVNQATDPTSWASPVWSFATGTFITVDNFESYTNDSPHRVFQAWIDGSGFSPDEFFPNGGSGNNTGSLVGDDPTLGNIMELVYICDGKQSMPLYYDNSASPKISEATRTLDPAKDTTDWSKYGLTTLVLFFHGDATNGAAPVYVKINNTKKVYGTAAATTIPYWRQWNIDLASIPAADLKNVQTITIGVGDGSTGGSGKILVDSIRLYAAAPAVAVPADPGTTGLIAYYAMNGDAQDASGNGNNGTLTGEPSFADGMTGFGKALALDGVNDCVDLGNKAAFNPTGSFSVSLWANITAWGTAWGNVMIGNRGESAIGWQIRRHSSTSLCFTTRGVDQDDMTSVMTPPQNKWINIVCVYDDAASTKAIYIDGHQDRLVNTTAGSHVAATTMNTFIGARAAAGNTPEAFFTGMLDEIRLFNRALTAGEAAYLAGDR